jgi:cytidylate kinase
MQRGEGASEADIKREAALLAARDQADSSRAVAPLRQADDARLLDTSELTFERQVDRIVRWAREALKAER